MWFLKKAWRDGSGFFELYKVHSINLNICNSDGDHLFLCTERADTEATGIYCCKLGNLNTALLNEKQATETRSQQLPFPRGSCFVLAWLCCTAQSAACFMLDIDVGLSRYHFFPSRYWYLCCGCQPIASTDLSPVCSKNTSYYTCMAVIWLSLRWGLA